MLRIKSLQGLRGWAILMIVLWHLNPLFPGNLPKLGNLGVEFFLMLSGFLIARKCDMSSDLRDFHSSAAYTFRKLRSSYPLYLFPAVPVFLLDVFAGPVKPEAPFYQLLSYCTLTQSWIPVSWIYWGVNGAGWFLPVVLFCYLMTPIIRKTVQKLGAGSVFFVCLLLQVAAELLADRFLTESFSDWLIYICPAYRLLDFALGFCAWHFFTQHRNESKRRLYADILFVCLLFVLAGLLLSRPAFMKYVLFHPFEIALLLTVASEKSILSNALNRNRVMIRLGDLSRIIFFTHVPVIRLTGIIWRRLFNPDLVFPLWIVSLLMILLFAVVTDRILKRLKQKTRKSPVH